MELRVEGMDACSARYLLDCDNLILQFYVPQRTCTPQPPYHPRSKCVGDSGILEVDWLAVAGGSEGRSI